MSVEMGRREGRAMRTQTAQSSDYLGALIEGEPRLVLVPLDPHEPWQAFRRLRSFMRHSPAAASVDVFEAPADLSATAKVIPLAARQRRTG